MQQSSENIQRSLEAQALQIPGLAGLPYAKALIKLLADYLAVLYSEQRDARCDLYRSFVDRVFPEPEGRSFPAHALAQVRPASGENELQTDWTFVSTDHPEIFFSPVYPVRLFPASIRYQAASQALLEYVDDKKLEIARFEDQLLPENGLWLGLEVSEETPLNGLSFQFDGLSEDKYALLPFVRFRQAQKPLDTSPGWAWPNDRLKPAFPDAEYLRLERIRKMICNRYMRQFITVNQCETSDFLPGPGSPALLEPLLPESVKQQNLLWLELVFPDGFSRTELANLNIRVNCFPVWNARMCRERGSYSTGTAIIPLTVNDEEEPCRNAFMGMVHVWSDDVTYSPSAISMRQKIGYTVHCGHLAAFNRQELALRIHDFIQRLDEDTIQFGTDHAHGLPFFDNLIEPLNLLKTGLAELRMQISQLPVNLLRPQYYLRLNLGAQAKKMIYFDYYETQGHYAMERLWPEYIMLAPARETTGTSLPGHARLLSQPIEGRNEWTLAEKEQLIRQRLSATMSTSSYP